MWISQNLFNYGETKYKTWSGREMNDNQSIRDFVFWLSQRLSNAELNNLMVSQALNVHKTSCAGGLDEF